MGFVTRFVPVGGLVSLARSFVRSFVRPTPVRWLSRSVVPRSRFRLADEMLERPLSESQGFFLGREKSDWSFAPSPELGPSLVRFSHVGFNL